MQTNISTEGHDRLHQAAKDLIAAAFRYWEVYQEVSPDSAAVVWVEDSDGRLFVMTRGEYKGQIMSNIPSRATPITFNQ